MNLRSTTKLPEATVAFVAILWLGMLLGVSFIATPVKFQAPSLSQPVALEIGRATFSLFSKIEWSIAALLILSLLACKRRIVSGTLCAGLVAILAAETFWLLPILDARVEAIISETPTPSDWHHVLYIGTEIIKAVLLVSLSIYLLRQLPTTWVPLNTPSAGNHSGFTKTACTLTPSTDRKVTDPRLASGSNHVNRY